MGQQLAPLRPAARPAAQPATASRAPTRSDLFYAGVVGSQSKIAPFKFFITCDEISRTYGPDAFFTASEKPENIEVGDMVVFTIDPNSSAVGSSPHAFFVAQLAPLGSLVMGGGGAPVPVADAGATLQSPP